MSDDFDDVRARIRAALAAKPAAAPDIEPDRLAEILDGTRRPTSLDLALIADAVGTSSAKLLTGDELADVRQILEVAADPTCWLPAHEPTLTRHQAMANALTAALDLHPPGKPVPAYATCPKHRVGRYWSRNYDACDKCVRLPDRTRCMYCGTVWPCGDVVTIARHLDPGAFAPSVEASDG